MKAEPNSRQLYWRARRRRAVWQRAARLGLVVSVIHIAINQGDHWLRHEVTTGVVIKTLLCPLVSFSIALHSVAATHADQLKHSRVPS